MLSGESFSVRSPDSESHATIGQRARELLMKSKLPMTTLGQIW